MELFGAASGLIDFIWLKVVPFLVVLTIIVFIHELGHYLVARWNKVKIDAFAVGFGPEIFGFYDKRGTRWKFCAIPLGGYVKFFGDANGTSLPDYDHLAEMNADDREGAFEHKNVWQRASVVVAGPVANFLLAIVIYTGLFMFHDDVKIAPVVGGVVPNSAASEAGFKTGDRILSINGAEVSAFRDISEVTMLSSGDTLTFVVDRAGENVTLAATPRMTEREDRFGNTYKIAQIGLQSDTSPENRIVTSLGPVDAFVKSLSQTWLVIKGTLNFIVELFAGKQEAKELRGPLGIGQMTSQVATLGIAQLMSLAGVISISIGLLNLFPIPMLDGGHLAFYAIEAVRGKPLSPKSMELAFKVGLTCVLALMVFATTNDIFRLIGMG